MRLILIAAVAIATTLCTMLIPTPGFAQRRYAQTFCIAGRGCVPTTQESYNACYQLALRRGLSVSRGDIHNLNSFIYQCLEGRIPR